MMNRRAYEKTLRALDVEDQARVLKLANDIGIDPQDPSWIFIAAWVQSSRLQQEKVAAFHDSLTHALQATNKAFAEMRRSEVAALEKQFLGKKQSLENSLLDIVRRTTEKVSRRAYAAEILKRTSFLVCLFAFMVFAVGALGFSFGQRINLEDSVQQDRGIAELRSTQEGRYLLDLAIRSAYRAGELVERCRNDERVYGRDGIYCQTTLIVHRSTRDSVAELVSQHLTPGLWLRAAAILKRPDFWSIAVIGSVATIVIVALVAGVSSVIYRCLKPHEH